MTQSTAHKDVFAGLKGALVDSLSKIAKEINSSNTSTAEYVRTLTATPDALQYVEELVIELFRSLCRFQPHATDGRYTTADIETRVNELFHSSIDRWVISEAQSHVTSYNKYNRNKKTLRLPADRIHLVSKQVFGRVDYSVTVYVTSVLEYVAADILKMTGNYVKNTRANEIQRQDVKIALSVDKVLMNVLFHEGAEETALHSGQWPLPAPVEDVSGGATSKPSPRAPLSAGDIHGLTYTQSVRNFEVCERQYLRTLQLILKVFREPFYRQFPRSKDIEVIFSTIHDVYELAANIVSMLEDVFDGVTDEQNEPALIGSCFEDLAEAQEFDVYSKYAKDILTPIGRERLSALLQRSDVVQQLCVQNTVNGRPAEQTIMRNAAKYLLPKLLLTPLCHFLSYTTTIYSLRDCARSEIAQLTQQGIALASSPSGAASGASASANAASLQQRTEDAEALDQCHGILLPIMNAIEKQLAQLALPTGNVAPSVGASLSGSQPTMSTAPESLFVLSGELDHTSIDSWNDTTADAQAQPAGATASGNTAQTAQGSAAASSSASGSGPGSTSSSSQSGGVRRVSAYQFWYANQHLLNVYSGGAVRRRAAIDKLEELHRVVENWDRAAMSSRTVNEFLIEGCLAKWTSRSKQSERYAFLFDSVLLLCKFASSSKRSSLASHSIPVATPLAYGCVGVLPNAAGAVREYKFKERVPLSRFEVIDRDDAPGLSGAERDGDAAGALIRSAGSVCFELHYYEVTASNPAVRQSIVLCAKNAEEKQIWLAELVSLQTMSMLDRLLDAKLKEEEKLVPLPLPNDTRTYRFAEKDIENVNIVFEENVENSGGEAQVLRGATLLKLVERLAYPWYVDLKFARTFLITYRDFCTPNRLLELLIERFSIPEPDLRALDQPASAISISTISVMPSTSNLSSSSAFGSSSSIASSSISASSVDSGASSISSMAAKRFRQEYAKPIKMRVLNVIKQWVEHHYYDFDDDPTLLARLDAFLRECCETGSARYTRKGIESVRRKMREQQALYAGDGGARRSILFDKSPPPFEWHLLRPPLQSFNMSGYSPCEIFMQLHPIEIARQSTLLEFETFREIKPNELIGSAWTKPNKCERSPNLMKMISYSNRFTYFLQHCVVDTENLEERCAVLLRIVDVLQVFNDLNNFSGIFQVISVIDSSAVHRLDHTMDYVNRSPRHARTLKECHELTQDHYRKYVDKLRMIDPPCVPFLGAYLTNLIHIEEGNPDHLRPPQRHTAGSTHGAAHTVGSSLTIPSATGRSSPAVEPTDEPQTDPPDETGTAEDSTERQREGKDEDRLINFTKRRKLADIISEIKQCQQKPYCLSPEPAIREFLENLNPFGGCSENDFQTMLYNKSLQIEPRGCRQLPRFPAKFQIPLKSPRVKPTATANSNPPPPATVTSARVAGSGSLASAHSLTHAGSGSTSLSFHTRSQSHTAAQTSTPPLRSVSPPSAHTHAADSLSLASHSSLSTASKSRSASNTNVSSFSAFDVASDLRRPAFTDETASISDFSLDGLANGGSQFAPSPISAKDHMRRNPSVNASSITLNAVPDDVISLATNLSSATSTSTIASLRSTKVNIANAEVMYYPGRIRPNLPSSATPDVSPAQFSTSPFGTPSDALYADDTTGIRKIDPGAGAVASASAQSSHTQLLHRHSLSDSMCESSFAIPTPSSLSSGAQTPDKSSRPGASAAGGGSHQHLAANFPRVASNVYPFPSPPCSNGSAHSADEVAPPLPPRRSKPQRGDSHSSSGTSNSSNVPSAVPSPIADTSFFSSNQPLNAELPMFVPMSTVAPPALPPRPVPLRNRPSTQSFDFDEPPNRPPKPKTKARALADHTESSSKSSLCDSPPVTGRRGSLQTNDCNAERAPPLPSRDRHATSRAFTAHSPAVSSRPHSHAAGGDSGSRNSTTSPTPIANMGYSSASQLLEMDEARSSSPAGGGFMNIAPFTNGPGHSASLSYDASLLDEQLQLDITPVEPAMPVDNTPQQVPPRPPKTYKKSITSPPQKIES